MSIDKEYADSLKKGIKELVDGISVENGQDVRILKLIYESVRAGFLESRAGKRRFRLMDDKGFLTAMPDKLLERQAKGQRKDEIISMAGSISNRPYIDMIYGFVRRLYMEERGNGKKKQE